MNLLILALLLISPIFGHVVEDARSIQPLARHVEEDETLKLYFKPTNLEVDERAEREMLELLNKEREARGLKALVWDDELTEVARKHSTDMWQRQYFAHENPDGESPFDRMEEGSVEFGFAGENLALSRTTSRAHNGLMNSDGHRRNMLDPNFTRVGIGVIDGGIYGKMFTQNFAD